MADPPHTMKRLLYITLLFAALGMQAAPLEGYIYTNARELEIIGKGWVETSGDYQRMPAYLKDSCRDNQWWLYCHSAGVAVRFATNSTRIAGQWNLINNFHMQHMAMTGIKGVDLYRLNQKGKWEYVNTARPQEKNLVADSVQSKLFVERMDGEWHEYMMYLPLYDGINWLEVGIDSTAQISKPRVNLPRREGKIVFYGTSVMQGGCASRPGMVATSIIERDLQRECVNLGTSGEGKMDMYVLRAMATIDDVSCYVIDPVPNCTAGMCDTLTYNFIRSLHGLRPDVPIVMVEGLRYPYCSQDTFYARYLVEKNAHWRRNYKQLRKDGIRNLYYVTWDGMTGRDEEGTVDGIHLTDLGFRAYADILEPLLKKICGR